MPRIVVMRFQLKGCRLRHWLNIVVAYNKSRRDGKHIEQLGSYDPMPNRYGENLVGLDYNRIRYWLGTGAEPTTSVAELLGLAGILPIHPRSLLRARRRRERLIQQNEEKLIQLKEAEDTQQLEE